MINFKFKSDNEISKNPLICGINHCKYPSVLNHSYSVNIKPKPICQSHWHRMCKEDNPIKDSEDLRRFV